MTKNTSTPTKPPGTRPGKTWKAMINASAAALIV